jgi:ABC-type polysaccharide transport system permease subunit
MMNLTGNVPTDILGIDTAFKHLYVWSGVWQGTGFGSIIYFAALSNVDPELHEAALVDGATRFQRALHIDLPSLLPTASILLIFSVVAVSLKKKEKVLLMQNPLNIGYSEVIATYVYKIGLATQRTDF